jgi:hypothetical protein
MPSLRSGDHPPPMFVPTKAEQCRAKADECEHLAARISLGPARDEILEMTRYWRRQAKEAERKEQAHCLVPDTKV